mgnify:CR=1 FL=1
MKKTKLQLKSKESFKLWIDASSERFQKVYYNNALLTFTFCLETTLW